MSVNISNCLITVQYVIQRPVSTLTKQNAAWNVNMDAGVFTSVNIDPQRCAVVGIHYELHE